MFVYILVVLIFIWTLISRWKSNGKWSALQKIPGPKPLPILGNVLDIKADAKASLDGMYALSQKYDGMFKMHLGPQGWSVFIYDPKYLEPVLSSSLHINKGGLYNLFKDWIGAGLGLINGDKWRKLRKVTSAMFQTRILNDFCKVFDEINRSFVDQLKEQHLNKAIDVTPLIEKHAFLHVFRTLISDEIAYDDMVTYGKNVSITKNISMGRFFSLKVFDFVFRLSKDHTKLYKSIGTIRDFFKKVIKKKIDDRSITISVKKTFLDLLLDYYKEKAEHFEKEIIHQVDNFVFAAHDTTSNSLCFSLFELSCHKDMQERLLKESNEIFGEDLSSEITMKGLESAEYLDMFCKEVLRKYPGAPLIGRITTDPLKLEDIDIPIGTNIMMLIYAMHRTPKHYPDPTKFDPERFSAKNRSSRSIYAHIPFSEGPRNCVGMRYGLLLFKSTLISLVRNFTISKGHPDFELELGQAATLIILNGTYVKIENRY